MPSPRFQRLIDRESLYAYRDAMNHDNAAIQLQQLTDKLDKLAELCRRLTNENRSLRQSQEHLAAERAQLLSKNEQARARVEAMITRLKSLEHNA